MGSFSAMWFFWLNREPPASPTNKQCLTCNWQFSEGKKCDKSLKSSSSKYPSFKLRSHSNDQMCIVMKTDYYNQEHYIVVLYCWLLPGKVVPRLQKRETSVHRHGEGTGNSWGIFHSACQLKSLRWGHLVCMDWSHRRPTTLSISHWRGLPCTGKKQQGVTRFFRKQT